MWRFTQNRIVIRKDISTVVKVPAEEVKEILEQMARLKINKVCPVLSNTLLGSIYTEQLRKRRREFC